MKVDKVANIKVEMVANMEVDKVADKVTDMVADKNKMADMEYFSCLVEQKKIALSFRMV